MTKKNKRVIIEPLNLTKTQQGYVPLGDRFKSFPNDGENAPRNNAEFYFNNYANQTLEHATIDLLFPPPAWLARLLPKLGLEGAYLKSGDGKLCIANNKFMVTVEKA